MHTHQVLHSQPQLPQSRQACAFRGSTDNLCVFILPQTTRTVRQVHYSFKPVMQSNSQLNIMDSHKDRTWANKLSLLPLSATSSLLQLDIHHPSGQPATQECRPNLPAYRKRKCNRLDLQHGSTLTEPLKAHVAVAVLLYLQRWRAAACKHGLPSGACGTLPDVRLPDMSGQHLCILAAARISGGSGCFRRTASQLPAKGYQHICSPSVRLFSIPFRW